jgi:NAD(P)-dependent dehydrogenase (short-subunit alcohol dehydrogenase family)
LDTVSGTGIGRGILLGLVEAEGRRGRRLSDQRGGRPRDRRRGPRAWCAGEHDDLAGAIRYFVGEAAGYVSGATSERSGGWLLEDV